MIASERKSARRIVVVGTIIVTCLLHSEKLSRADDAGLSETTTKYFRELRRRGLFKLAESYCRERLSHSTLSAAERTDLTLELSRTLAEHADFVGNSEQDELWARSEAALVDLLKQDPENPRRLLLEVQRSLLPATIGHSRRLLAELNPYDGSAQKQAQRSLQSAVEGLRAVEATIITRQRKTPGARATTSGGIRPFELRPLLGNVRLRLGGALLDLALLQPADSPDHIALLMDSQKMFKSVGESVDDDDLIWQTRLSLVECSRLLEDLAKALHDIDALEKLGPPDEFADRLLAERIRVLIAQQGFRDAATLVVERERGNRAVSGELQSLAIELAIADFRAKNRAADSRLPSKLLQTLEERASRLRRDVGGYWSVRSEQMIRRVQDSQQYGAELAELAGKAQAAFNSGETEQAVELYGRAAAQARRDGRADLAFQFGFTRGSIEIKSQSWDSAAADLIELVDQFPKNPKTPQAHLLAAYALGKAYDAHPTSERGNDYARVLGEHRANYANDPTCHEATWMLAELEEGRGRIEQALALYELIPVDHKRAAAARLAAARSFEKILGRLPAGDESAGGWEDRAVKSLQKLLPSGREGALPLDALQAEVAVRLARILLRRTPPQFEPADRLLARVVTSLAPRDADTAAEDEMNRATLRATARQLQVISLAGQGKFQPARKLLQQLSATGPAELLRILEGLAPLQSDEKGDPFRELGELQLEAALKLEPHRSELSQADQRRLDECLARGHFAAGQPQRGFEIYDKLLQKAPRDRELLLAYAGLLDRCGNKACRTQAVSVRRKLEALHEPGARDWYPARYELCRALLAAGQPVEARSLLQVTRLVFPKPEDEALQKKLAELEAEANTEAKSK